MKTNTLTLPLMIASLAVACGDEIDSPLDEEVVSTSSSEQELLHWTNYEAACPNNTAVYGLQCSQEYCSYLSPICQGLPQGVAFRPGSYTRRQPFFSEEQGYRQCPTGTVMTGIRCDGLFCDNVALNCQDIDHNINYSECFDRSDRSFFSGAISEENVSWRSQDMMAVGMRCIGSYCDFKTFKICKLGSSLQISLKTSSGWFVQAQEGGGFYMNAQARQENTWERFDVVGHRTRWDECGRRVADPLMSGTWVRLRTHRGHVVSSLGGDAFAGFDERPLHETQLRLQKVDPHSRRVIGGEIRSGDWVTLRGPHGYLVAEGNGGGDVNMNRGAAGPWEVFQIRLRIQQHSRPINPPANHCYSPWSWRGRGFGL